MDRPWRAVWAAICRSLVDELPPEALGPLRVAFKKGGATTIAALFSDLDGQEAFTGPKAEQNLDTLLLALQKWEDNGAMVQLRKELSTYYPALVTQPVLRPGRPQELPVGSIPLGSLADSDPVTKNHPRDRQVWQLNTPACFLLSADQVCEEVLVAGDILEPHPLAQGRPVEIPISWGTAQLYRVFQDKRKLVLVWKPSGNIAANARGMLQEFAPHACVYLLAVTAGRPHAVSLARGVTYGARTTTFSKLLTTDVLTSNPRVQSDWDAGAYFPSNLNDAHKLNIFPGLVDLYTDESGDAWLRLRETDMEHTNKRQPAGRACIVGEGKLGAHLAVGLGHLLLRHAVVDNSQIQYQLRFAETVSRIKDNLCAIVCKLGLVESAVLDIQQGSAILIIRGPVDVYWRLRAEYPGEASICGLKLTALSRFYKPLPLVFLAAQVCVCSHLAQISRSHLTPVLPVIGRALGAQILDRDGLNFVVHTSHSLCSVPALVWEGLQLQLWHYARFVECFLRAGQKHDTLAEVLLVKARLPSPVAQELCFRAFSRMSAVRIAELQLISSLFSDATYLLTPYLPEKPFSWQPAFLLLGATATISSSGGFDWKLVKDFAERLPVIPGLNAVRAVFGLALEIRPPLPTNFQHRYSLEHLRSFAPTEESCESLLWLYCAEPSSKDYAAAVETLRIWREWRQSHELYHSYFKWRATQLSKELISRSFSVSEHLLSSLAFALKDRPSNLFTPLCWASGSGREDLVRSLLEQDPRPNVNEISTNGHTPLSAACTAGELAVVTLLLRQPNIQVNTRNRVDGMSPLLYACVNQHTAVAKVLLEHHVDVNLADARHVTPLFVACTHNDYELVKLLVEAEADVMRKYPDGFTALGIVCRHDNGDARIARLLLDKGADLADMANDGLSCLAAASLTGLYDVVSELLQHKSAKAVLNARSPNGRAFPLLVACEHGHLGIVKVLLKAGAKIDMRNVDEATPFYVACANGHLEIADFLLTEGSALHVYARGGWSALTAACSGGHIYVVKMLLARGKKAAQMLMKPPEGVISTTSFHPAAAHGHVEILELLFNVAPKLLDSSDGGLTPLYAACQHNEVRAVKWLLAHGANPNFRTADGNWTSLRIAVHEGSLDVLNELLACGKVDLEERNSNGETALYTAIRVKRSAAILALLNAGADVNCVTPRIFGYTPLHYAVLSQSPDVLAAILNCRNVLVNKTGTNGLAPLHLAYAVGNEAAVKALLAQPAIDVTLRDLRFSATPQMWSSIGQQVLRRTTNPAPLAAQTIDVSLPSEALIRSVTMPKVPAASEAISAPVLKPDEWWSTNETVMAS